MTIKAGAYVQRMNIRIRWANKDIGPPSLYEAILEALTQHGVVEEAQLLLLEGESPDSPGATITFFDGEYWPETLEAPQQPEEMRPTFCPPCQQGRHQDCEGCWECTHGVGPEPQI